MAASAEKSPKLRFLERKLRLKESLVSSLKRKKQLQARQGDNCHFDIAFANLHEPPAEERDNLTGRRLSKAGMRQQFTQWHSN